MLKKVVSVLGFCLPSWLTRPLFRLVGHRVGRNAALPMFTYIHAGQIELGDDVDIRPFVFVSVGELKIGSNTIISFGTQVKGEKAFHTGDNCFVGPHTIIHCDENVRFGFYSGVGPRCTIYTHGSFLPVTLGYPAVFSEVTLEDYVWTAMGVLFLPGAHVESNCIINAGVVVSGRIRSGTRLQVSAEAVKHIEQSKLLRFSRRSPGYYHQAIIKGFLGMRGIKLQEELHDTVFRSNNGIEFRSFPESNQIELWRSHRRIAGYDLETFHTDNSRDKTHRQFLGYIRRRFGLALRTRYH
jgi:acetyltransferase-like isoleucine patch superfamily enzyme